MANSDMIAEQTNMKVSDSGGLRFDEIVVVKTQRKKVTACEEIDNKKPQMKMTLCFSWR